MIWSMKYMAIGTTGARVSENLEEKVAKLLEVAELHNKAIKNLSAAVGLLANELSELKEYNDYDEVLKEVWLRNRK